MLGADRDRCRSDQLLRQLRPHLVAAVIAESRQALARDSAEGLRGRILMQQCGGEFGVEVLEISGELGKTQVHQSMELICKSQDLI